MDIVVISPFNVFPPYWGGAARIVGIVNGLLTCEETTVHLLYPSWKQISGKDNAGIHHLFSRRAHNARLQVYEIPTSRRLGQFLNAHTIMTGLRILRKNHNSIVWCEFAWSGLHGLLLSLFSRRPLFLDEHNIEHVRFRRFGSWFYPIVKMLEVALWIWSKKILVVSQTDRSLISSQTIRNKTSVISNGYDSQSFKPCSECGSMIRGKHHIDDSQPLLLFFGKLDYSPNAEALEVIRRELAPIFQTHGIKIMIAGSGLPDEFVLPSCCIYVGVVHKISDYINASDAVIVPLKSGGGTRLKIIETLACGIPVVTTVIGAEGLPVDKLSTLLSVCEDNDWSGFVSKTQAILNDPPSSTDKEIVRRRIKRYSWDAVAERIQEIVRWAAAREES